MPSLKSYVDNLEGPDGSPLETADLQVPNFVSELNPPIPNPVYSKSIFGSEEADLLVGGSGDDFLYGGLGQDTLRGLIGKDTLDGGQDADYLVGGFGSDTYYIDDIGDQIVESLHWDGVDHIYSSIDYEIGQAQIENVTLTGSANISAIGNGLNNIIFGNTGDNIRNGA